MATFLAGLAAFVLLLALLGLVADAWDRRRVADSWQRNHARRAR